MKWSETSPDQKFVDLFRNICRSPAMYIGEENYYYVAHMLSGLALGYKDWHGGFYHTFLHKGFQRFLAKKYKRKNATYENVCWEQIIPLALKDERPRLTQKQLIDRLLADFEDYNNILVRLAVESDD